MAGLPSYNLLDEKWIPVLTVSGHVESVGIRELFQQADSLVDLACELPTQSFALYRLLLSILYRATDGLYGGDGASAERQWRELWTDGLPSDEIDEYLLEWHDRFYLLGGDVPFHQVADLRTAKDAVSGLEKIIADVPNGSQFFTTRAGEALERIPCSEAAIWLVHAQAFDPSGIRSGVIGDSLQKGGKGYPIGPSWAGQIGGVLVVGDTIAQTLMLNFVPYDYLGVEHDEAIWERDQQPTSVRGDFTFEKGERPIPGPARLYTWPSRRVRLVGSLDGITGVILSQGDKLAEHNMHEREPMSGWRHSLPQSRKLKTKVYMARRHDATQSFWRTLPAMLPASTGESGRLGKGQDPHLPAATLRFLANESIYELVGSPMLRVRAVGVTYGSMEAVIDEVYSDEVAVSAEVLGDRKEEVTRILEQAVRRADEVSYRLGVLARDVAQAGGDRSEEPGAAQAQGAQATFYARLDGFAPAWMTSFVRSESLELHLAEWDDHLRSLAYELGGELVTSAPPSARQGRLVSVGGGTRLVTLPSAEQSFFSALHRILPRVRKVRT